MTAIPSEQPDERRAREQEQFAELSHLDAHSPAWEEIRGVIIEEHLPLAKYLAAKYFSRTKNHDDLIQIASIGLVKAVDNFDPEKGFAFSTYATPVILGELRRYFRDQAETIRIPRDIQQRRTQLATAAQNWIEIHSTTPRPQDLANELNVPLEDVVEALSFTPGSEPLDESLIDGDSAVDFDRVEIREAVKAAMGQLPEIEREVVWLRFFDNKSQTQIAECLNISQSQVSRVLNHALDTLRLSLD